MAQEGKSSNRLCRLPRKAEGGAGLGGPEALPAERRHSPAFGAHHGPKGFRYDKLLARKIPDRWAITDETLRNIQVSFLCRVPIPTSHILDRLFHPLLIITFAFVIIVLPVLCIYGGVAQNVRGYKTQQTILYLDFGAVTNWAIKKMADQRHHIHPRLWRQDP